MRLRKKIIIHFKKKDMFVIIFSLVFLCVFLIFYLLNKYITPILLDYAEIETTKLSTLIINKAVDSHVNNNVNISDLVDTTLNSNNEIVSVDFDTNLVNKILVSINDSIQANLKYLEEGKLEKLNIDTNYESEKIDSGIVYQIPFGVISDIPMLADIGPKIPVKTTLIGSVFSNVKVEATEYGINSALLKVYIEVTVTEQVILPFLSKRIDISLDIPIFVKVINGSIPEVYGGMYSVNSPLKENS